MSKFSEKLKYLIEEGGIKIYQLSKSSGLDRTTIQRAMSGERLPSLNFVEKMAAYLRLSPSDQEELFNLYSISKIGEKVYAGRKYIKELIERLATIHSAGENTIHTVRNTTYSGKISEDISVYEGQYLINNMIRNVLEDEVINQISPQINISVPFQCSFLYDLLYQLYLSENGRINIKNIVRFNKISAYQNANYNLDVLSHVMPFAFSGGKGYQVYYYYDNFDYSYDISLLMPFYIITSKRLITFSADYNSAVLYNNESIVNLYKNKFDAALHKSAPLIAHLNTCEDILQSYLQSFKNTNTISHVLEPQPCFSWYYSDELINLHLIPDLENRDTLLKLITELYREYRNYSHRPISIFSVEGLRAFATTGILADLPTQFATPFTLEERIMLLESLRKDISLGIYQVYAANASKFVIPFATIQLYKNEGLDFFTTNNNGIMSSANISEKSIAEAFYEFFESLPDSELIHTKEETINIIDSCIEQCTLMK
jgi:transcriptional regulator with XRE-family HTH domain